MLRHRLLKNHKFTGLQWSCKNKSPNGSLVCGGCFHLYPSWKTIGARNHLFPKERENSRAKGTEGCNLESVFPPVTGFFVTKYLSKAGKAHLFSSCVLFRVWFNCFPGIRAEQARASFVLQMPQGQSADWALLYCFTGKYRCAKNSWVQKEVPCKQGGKLCSCLGSLFKAFPGEVFHGWALTPVLIPADQQIPHGAMQTYGMWSSWE